MSVLDEECIYYMGLFVYELFKSFQTYGTMQCVTEYAKKLSVMFEYVT